MSSSKFEIVSANKCHGGMVTRYKHVSSTLGNLEAHFTIFVPPAGTSESKFPLLYFLSGLTCSDLNFVQKGGAFALAAAKGIALVAPDTSPRGANVDGEDESWDLGSGAGFYLNASAAKWREHYRMYDYVVEELPECVSAVAGGQVDVLNCGVTGHSMGGLGALVVALRNADRFRSVSAFAPICNPSACPWGLKAFGAYLGDSDDAKAQLWRQYDPCALVGAWPKHAAPILIDQGDADKFLADGQLQPDAFEAAAKQAGVAVDVRMQPGYDHSYFFIATFIGDHIDHHARALLPT
jgi:S-formylglutathione hydrolase